MKADCDRESLLSACQLVGAAVSSRDVKPILRNFKVIGEGDRCTLMGTDLEVGIRFDVQNLVIQEPGESILPAARLVAILREARDTRLSIEADTTVCVIRGASLEFEMPGEDPSQFPDIPTFNDEKYHEISAGSLREMIRRTIFATADETARYSMTGVLWELEGDVIRLVATDGRRLALAQGTATPQGGHSTKGQAPVVPTKAMSLLERNLQVDEDPVKICLRPNEVLFRTGRATIYSRLVEGRFPDYKQVMPRKAVTKVPLSTAPFQAAVRQAAVMTDEDSKRVTFRFANNQLTLEARGASAGRSKVELPIAFDAKPVEINFNPSYLVDMLKVLPADEEITLDLVDGASPALFRHGTAYSYLVMPLT
jgi:DNA polymerase III subunit beta